MTRFVLLLAIGFSAAAGLAGTAHAADPLYLQLPYDEVTLNEANGNVLLKVKPLSLPGRKVPAPGARTGDLDIELIDRPGERYKVEWASIASVKLFEELVLAEADEQVKAGRYDEAYPYFHYLETKHPQTTGLKESFENFLWVQIIGAFKAGRNEEALALLVELYPRNPQRPGMNNAYRLVTEALVKQHLADENYRAARGLLRNLGQRFPETVATTVAPYEAQLKEKAAALLTEARAQVTAGKLPEAHQTCGRMLEIWPAIEGGQQLALSIHQRHPLVVVGVTSPLGTVSANPGDDWAALRAGRLLGRPLVERAAAAADGSAYRSTFGEVSRGEDARQITLKLQAGIPSLDPARELTAHDVARSLLARADSARAAFDPAWADVFAGVAVQSPTDVSISFRQPQLVPEAWLAMPLFFGGGSAGESASVTLLGPYQLASQTPEQASFVRRIAAANESKQPGEIVERTYRDSASAVRALRRGEISVIDRIDPWDLPRLTTAGEITVVPYALPRVHLLIPNPHRPLTANRTLRRALVYGLDRPGILSRGLLDEQTIAGCEVVTGPFPKGASADDPHGYAYNAAVEDRPYDPGLAMALVRLAIEETNAARQAGGEAPLASPAPLVLAHPAEPIARVACQSIARQLRLLGLAIEVRELAAGQQPEPDVDLVYAEVAMREPVVGAWRLLGPGGLTGSASPAMIAALRSLDGVTDAGEASARLQTIHRLAAGELPVIPLWQLVDHLAYHKSVAGIAPRPLSLYDDIEQWQVEFRIPPE